MGPHRSPSIPEWRNEPGVSAETKAAWLVLAVEAIFTLGGLVWLAALDDSEWDAALVVLLVWALSQVVLLPASALALFHLAVRGLFWLFSDD